MNTTLEPSEPIFETEQVTEVESLRAISHHLRMALDQIHEGVIIIEGEPLSELGPRIVYGNRASFRLTKLRPEELLGQPIGLIFEGERLEVLLSRLPVVAKEGRCFRIKAGLGCAGGATKRGSWTVSAVTGDDGKPLNYTLTFSEEVEPEVVEKVEDEDPEVEGRRAVAEDASGPDEAIEAKCKTETLAFIASGIAHDFNNVLTPVIGNLSLVEHEVEKGSEMARQISSAKSAAEEAKALARQILDFAKGEGVKKEPGDVGRLLKEAARLATTGANVRCDMVLESGLAAVEMNASQILNVFNNLLINARQAMPEGGVVQTSAGITVIDGQSDVFGLMPGRYVEVKVRDRGCGISEEDLENIFLAFFSTKGKAGTGLGLATCRSIVREHGGEITVKSKVDVGTEFRVYLPACGADESRDEEPRERQPVMKGEGCVLVVDDQDSIRTVAAAIIEKLGYEAVSARSGEQAVEIYQDRMREGRVISAVLLDMTLPGGMSGMDTLEELLGVDPDVRTIASSGYFDEDALASYRERGYVGVLPKPYTVERLSKSVHDAIHFDARD